METPKKGIFSMLKKYWYIVLPTVLAAIYMSLDKMFYSAQKVAEAAANYESTKLGGLTAAPADVVDYYLNRAGSDAAINSKLTAKITKPISQFSLMEKIKLMKELKALNV